MRCLVSFFQTKLNFGLLFYKIELNIMQVFDKKMVILYFGF